MHNGPMVVSQYEETITAIQNNSLLGESIYSHSSYWLHMFY